MLKISLLGTPQLKLEEPSLSNSITGKRLALFVYLSVTGEAQNRDVLANLLWCDVPNRRARKNLRDILPTLRKQLGKHLIITDETITFNRRRPYWLDVEVFRTHLTTKQVTSNPMMLREALELYQGDFLGSFYVRHAPVFEEWVLQQREQMQKEAVEGLERLANHYLAQGDYAAALLITNRLLTMEPWREQAHRLQMMLLALSGARSAALAQYATCERLLAEEYGCEPLPETTILYQQINSGRLVAYNPKMSVNWDAIPNPPQLYGRQRELEQLEEWLMVEGCQLVGLFGVGGQGKSALVAQLIHQLADSVAPFGEAYSPTGRAKAIRADDNDPMRFDYILCYSLIGMPPLPELLSFFLRRLLPKASPEGREERAEEQIPDTPMEQLASLMDCLRRQRCLLVIDHVEQLMQAGSRAGCLKPGYELYGELWRWVAENQHQSSLILISREEPEEFSRLERHNRAVRSLPLTGIPVEAGVKMLEEAGLTAQDKTLATLVQRYSSHPLALTLVYETIQDLQIHNSAFFFSQEPVIFDQLRDILEQHVSRLSATERQILSQLATLGGQEPVDFKSLWHNLAQPPEKHAYLSALRSLQRRSLLEPATMRLPNLLRTYFSERLAETSAQKSVIPQESNSQSWQKTISSRRLIGA